MDTQRGSLAALVGLGSRLEVSSDSMANALLQVCAMMFSKRNDVRASCSIPQAGYRESKDLPNLSPTTIHVRLACEVQESDRVRGHPLRSFEFRSRRLEVDGDDVDVAYFSDIPKTFFSDIGPK